MGLIYSLTSPIAALVGALAGAIVAALLTTLSYEGISVLGFQVVDGIIHQRIEAEFAKAEREGLNRQSRAAATLRMRDAERVQETYQRIERDAQRRVDLAKGQAGERERFLQAQIEQMQSQLSNQQKGKTDVCSCPYPGDTRPSDSFLQQYQSD